MPQWFILETLIYQPSFFSWTIFQPIDYHICMVNHAKMNNIQTTVSLIQNITIWNMIFVYFFIPTLKKWHLLQRKNLTRTFLSQNDSKKVVVDLLHHEATIRWPIKNATSKKCPVGRIAYNSQRIVNTISKILYRMSIMETGEIHFEHQCEICLTSVLVNSTFKIHAQIGHFKTFFWA